MKRVACGDVGDDLIGVLNVVIVARGAQRKRHDAAQIHFDIHRQVQRPG